MDKSVILLKSAFIPPIFWIVSASMLIRGWQRITRVSRSGHPYRAMSVKAAAGDQSSLDSPAFGTWGLLVASAAAAFSISNWKDSEHTASACGIVGFVGSSASRASDAEVANGTVSTSEGYVAVDYLLEGLTILQNRGYDSAGVATVTPDNEIVVTKYASLGSTSDSIDLLKAKAPSRHAGHSVGIAHTRWATHGGKTDENAHPHFDMKHQVAVVHNGTIENHQELKLELQKKGYTFQGQTDTEVIANLVGLYLEEEKSHVAENVEIGINSSPLVRALKKTIQRLEGTWGLCVISKDEPEQIVIARNGSPLIVGIGEGHMFVASEHSAFRRHTGQYIALRDGEVAVVNANGVSLDLSRKETIAKEDILLSPEPFPHWTIREINEQPAAVNRALNFGGRLQSDGKVKLGGLEENLSVLETIKNLVVSGCGTSLFAAQYGAQIMRFLNAFDTVQTVDAAELQAERFPMKNGGLLVISQSGETLDVQRAVVLAEDLGIPKFSIVNSVGSLIARTTKCGVYLNAGREHAVASTKAFITQVTVLALVAGWFAQLRHGPEDDQKREQLISALLRLPIYTGMCLQLNERTKEIAEKIKDVDNMFVLGKGYGFPIAQEGALKLKEITYIHAEGQPVGALQHGTLALIEKGTPVILLVLNDKNMKSMIRTAQEVKARGAFTIIITDDSKSEDVIDVADEIIPIPSNGPLTALLGVVPLQLLAYHLAVARGINPDKPKNLAKAVTVD